MPMMHDEILFWDDEKLKILEDPHFINNIKKFRSIIEREITII